MVSVAEEMASSMASRVAPLCMTSTWFPSRSGAPVMAVNSRAYSAEPGVDAPGRSSRHRVPRLYLATW